MADDQVVISLIISISWFSYVTLLLFMISQVYTTEILKNSAVTDKQEYRKYREKISVIQKKNPGKILKIMAHFVCKIT